MYNKLYSKYNSLIRGETIISGVISISKGLADTDTTVTTGTTFSTRLTSC
ncbi:MAG: hypothetical protein ACM3PT_00835 [Deltaproteobacteria bacterium]